MSSNSLEDLISNSKITGTPAETVNINSVVHRSLATYLYLILADYAGSFSLITKKKLCKCLITLMYHDNI